MSLPRLKITFLVPPDNLSGGIRVVATYARELQSRGHAVTVVMEKPHSRSFRERLRLFKRGKIPDALQRTEPVIKGHLSHAGVHILEFAKHDIVRGEDVPAADLVIATWWETVEWMKNWPPHKGRQLHLVQGYEIWFDDLTNARVKAALRSNTVKVAVSEPLRQEIEQELDIRGVHVIRNGIDLRLFDTPARALNDVPQVGYVYSTTPSKALERYKRIVDSVRDRIPELRIMAFGAEPPHPDFPLPDNTEYFYQPSQTLLPKLYASCDAWLFASRIDSFGLPVLEAMASRTPVVSLPVGAAPELLRRGGGVLISPVKEDLLPERFASAVSALCTDAVYWRACSDVAYQKTRVMGWDSSVDQFERLLYDIIRGDRRLQSSW